MVSITLGFPNALGSYIGVFSTKKYMELWNKMLKVDGRCFLWTKGRCSGEPQRTPGLPFH